MAKQQKRTAEDKAQKKEAKLLRKAEKIKNRKFYGRTSLVFSGTVVGTGLGGLTEILFAKTNNVLVFGLGAVIGFILSFLAGHFIKNKSERLRMQVQYAICGALPGFMILGNPYLIQPEWGAILGAIVFAGLFAFVLAPLLYRKKEKGKYQPFPGEGGMFTIFGLITSYAGDEIAGLINTTKLFAIPKKILDIKTRSFTTVMIAKKGLWFTIGKAVIGFAIPTLLVLIAFLWIGLALAANRRRPVFGATLAIIGGAEISFIGFKVAPMLFVPGSGLVWVGLIDGLLIIAMSLTAIYYSILRVPLGVVIIVLAVLSYVGAAGGLIFGGLLGIFGGAMITTWQDPALSNDKQVPMSSQLPPSQGASI